jgi:hypothetical protein
MDEITALDTFFNTQLGTVAALTSCVSTRRHNGIAVPKTPFPYALYTVIPLNDKTGQARTSIQTRCLVDFKILCSLSIPLPATLDAAVAGVKEHFRSSRTFDSNGYRISVRHERPIFYIEKGAAADQNILHQGGTYRCWMSAI